MTTSIRAIFTAKFAWKCRISEVYIFDEVIFISIAVNNRI